MSLSSLFFSLNSPTSFRTAAEPSISRFVFPFHFAIDFNTRIISRFTNLSNTFFIFLSTVYFPIYFLIFIFTILPALSPAFCNRYYFDETFFHRYTEKRRYVFIVSVFQVVSRRIKLVESIVLWLVSRPSMQSVS